MSLRDYFSEPAPWDLLSVSYNPDARYAFVNFSSESARLSAIRQAAARLFEGRRLDCRIRHEAQSRSTKVDYGLNSRVNKRPLFNGSSAASCCDRATKSLRSKVEEFANFPEADRSSWGREKYFILKSFSLDALYQSLETGRWHVPKRHVERLNHAFQTASKVYLIFSVNGSGCFFGYATMRSEIHVEDDDLVPFADEVHIMSAHHDLDVEDDSESSQHGEEIEGDAQSWTRSRTESLASSDSSHSYSSSSLSSVSSGSIIYQPERRRIVWEASWLRRTVEESTSPGEELQATPCVVDKSPIPSSCCCHHYHPPDSDRGNPHPPSTAKQASSSHHHHPLRPSSACPSPPPSTFHAVTATRADPPPSFLTTLDRFSSPCAIKWLCAQGLPFAAVRGLTNPWNSDKAVHVARNVTPVEPGVATALLECWGRAVTATTATTTTAATAGRRHNDARALVYHRSVNR
ncbi:hypothetical protein AYL99_01152 [Fonsecaea erecta]|uniref:YTH domain-containing protein n=1 Tax=Fonsecaea erecta TaxID=1367422 RepID=A0A178ZZ83_9EURO|nr:hypothetical protein AYL99_01152 [Fonsecaea erecta]OAP65180.1 hypothetical protein AYL99_01152 [Fonsecaea erecta]